MNDILAGRQAKLPSHMSSVKPEMEIQVYTTFCPADELNNQSSLVSFLSLRMNISEQDEI